MLFWPFMLLTVALTAGLGFLISQIEREKVMKDWSNRRCQVAIMAMGSYFKPKDDPRTPSQFSKDNFSFCMDNLVKTVTSQVMTPLSNVFSKQGETVGIVQQTINAIRVILKKIYDAFMEYISEFLRRYNNIAQQVRTVTLHLKAAFGRVNAMMISMVYMGLTMIKGMMNTIDFVFKVVLIILGIMVALIILLWFILFPFIPIILSVIGAIVAVAIGTMAGTAASYKNAFCFAPETVIVMKDGSVKPISQIQLGDVLLDGIVVDSVMKMSGKEVPLWSINGVYVTGTHLVKKENEEGWHPVKDDSRATRTSYIEGYVYCLNTSTHTIPVLSSQSKLLYFRDWEELEDTDLTGHYEWNYNVIEQLNQGKSSDEWSSSIEGSLEYPSISPTSSIRTPTGLRKAIDIEIGDIVYDQNYNLTQVLGIVRTNTHIPKENLAENNWVTNMIYKNNEVWQRMYPAGKTQLVPVTGINIITEEGTFVAVIGKNNIILRDFTEIGYKHIESTNKCVEARLRSQVKKMS
jgi:hypothetical protein